MYQFLKGFLTLPRAVPFLLGHRRLWAGIILPLGINLIVLAGTLYFVFRYARGLVDSFLPQAGWYGTALGVVGDLVAVLLSVIVALIMFVALGTVLAGPFNDWLGVKTLRLLGHPVLEANGFLHNSVLIFRGLVENCKEVFFFVIISTVLFGLAWFPVIGMAVPFLSIVFMCYSLAFSMVGPSLSDRDVSFRDKRRILAGNRSAVFGFGAACFLMLLIPFAGFFLLPVGVVGGALLYHQCLYDDRSTP